MANQAFLSIWCREISGQAMGAHFVRLLEKVPYSPERPGIASLTIRAVDPAEPLLAEFRFTSPAEAEDVAGLVGEYLSADSAYEAEAFWNLWTRSSEGKWARGPEGMEIFCFGPEYDEGAPAQEGHFRIRLGFEHLFTGHAGLLGIAGPRGAGEPQHPAEAEFLRAMQDPAKFREYQERTQENVRELFDWTRRIEAALPVERYQLWSEGEDNFEARLDEILAVR